MMREVVCIPIKDVIPSAGAVLKAQGIPQAVTPSAKVTRLVQESVSAYRDLADPVGVVAEIPKSDFEAVYRGEGRNEMETPLDGIYKSSESLALFAVTIGENVCREISRLFGENEPARGSMLDSVASEGVEMAACAVRSYYAGYLKEWDKFDSSMGVVPFSPGYCGWHVSGQKKLFEFLRPGEIGIGINESFLMQPLKSISGVIVAGPKGIFEFDDSFPFCRECDTHSCRDRIAISRGQ